MDDARVVLDYWFGRGDPDAEELAARMRFWFAGGAPGEQHERDEEVRERFVDLMLRAERGELTAWADSPRRRLALILLFDQFPRQVYRGSARAFATDPQALGLTLSGMQAGADAALAPAERLFFYMPLQHAESPEAQDESLAAYRRLLAEVPEAMRDVFQRTLEYAEKHHEIVRRFGRFPHRNRALGRPTTPEELVYLRNADTFGQ